MAVGLGLGGSISLPTLVQRITVDTRDIDKAAASIGGRFGAMLPTVAKVGSAMTKFVTLPILGIGVAAAKAAIDFESSFAGVRKTVDATEAEFEALAQGFRNLALEIPVSVNELNRIGELGGQLGVAKEQLIDFTRVVASLSVATNLSTEQAAEDLARFATILQLPQTQFENVGSAVVDLGNKFAGTESEIIGFGLRIAGAGKIAGLSAGEILGIGTAMSSVGVEVERGGTAVQRVLIEMTKAAAQGGSALGEFAKVAGTTADEFARLFQDDPAEAFVRFVEGLGRSGQEAFNILERLELADARLIASFTALAGAGQQLRDALQTGNSAFELNIALAVEAEKRFATFESRLGLFRNRINDALIDAGPAILDALEPVLDIVEAVAKAFTDLPAPVQRAVVQLGLVAAAIGPGLLLAAKFATAWAKVRAVLEGTRFASLVAGMVGMNRQLSTLATAEAAAGFNNVRITATGAAVVVGRLGTALRVLGRIGVAAAVLGVIELTQRLAEAQRKAQDLASRKFPGVVGDTQQIEDEREALSSLVDEIRLTKELKDRFGTPIEAIVSGGALDVTDRLAILRAELERLEKVRRSHGVKGFFENLFGFGVGAEVDAIAHDLVILEKAVVATDAALSGATFRSVNRGKPFPILDDKDITALGKYRDLIIQANERGADAAAVAEAILRGNVDLARQLALGLEEAAEKGETVVLPIEQLREALKFATEDELKAFNDRLKESTKAVDNLFKTLVGEKLELPDLGLGDRVEAASADAILDAENKIADINDRLKDLDDKQREQRGRDRAATLRDIDAARRDLSEAQRDLGKASQRNITEGFQSIVTSNVAFMRRFFDDIGQIARAGFPLLANTLVDMGAEGARIAREAVAKIAGGEGLGTMEQALIDAVLLSKRGLDGAIARFKPNIEEVAGDNIVSPLRDKLNEIGFLIAKGLPPESAKGFLDIFIEEFDRLTALKGVELDPLTEGLIQAAEEADTAAERFIFLQSALDSLSPPPLDIDIEKFTEKEQDVLRRLNKLGLLNTVTDIAADPSKAFGAIGETVRRLTGLTEKQWRAIVNAIVEKGEAERDLDELTKERTVRIKAEFESQLPTPLRRDLPPGTEYSAGGHTYRVLEDGSIRQVRHMGGLVMHGGGLLPGSGEVDIRALRGEFIVNPMSTRRYLPLLHAINNDRKMHDGGVVSPRGSDGTWLEGVVIQNLNINGPVYADSDGVKRLARDLAPAIDSQLRERRRQR